MLSKQFPGLCNRRFISGVTKLPLREQPRLGRLLPLICRSRASVHPPPTSHADGGARGSSGAVWGRQAGAHPRGRLAGGTPAGGFSVSFLFSAALESVEKFLEQQKTRLLCGRPSCGDWEEFLDIVSLIGETFLENTAMSLHLAGPIFSSRENTHTMS